LATSVSTNSVIEWEIFNIDPNSPLVPQLTSIGSADVWGASGQPESNGKGGFVGQAQANGSDSYQIALNLPQAGGAGITARVNPSMTVK